MSADKYILLFLSIKFVKYMERPLFRNYSSSKNILIDTYSKVRRSLHIKSHPSTELISEYYHGFKIGNVLGSCSSLPSIQQVKRLKSNEDRKKVQIDAKQIINRRQKCSMFKRAFNNINRSKKSLTKTTLEPKQRRNNSYLQNLSPKPSKLKEIMNRVQSVIEQYQLKLSEVTQIKDKVIKENSALKNRI